VFNPPAQMEMQAGDTLLAVGGDEGLQGLWEITS
jgi:uncharacterized protein with PhoU and TrkA domain